MKYQQFMSTSILFHETWNNCGGIISKKFMSTSPSIVPNILIEQRTTISKPTNQLWPLNEDIYWEFVTPLMSSQPNMYRIIRIKWQNYVHYLVANRQDLNLSMSQKLNIKTRFYTNSLYFNCFSSNNSWGVISEKVLNVQPHILFPM